MKYARLILLSLILVVSNSAIAEDALVSWSDPAKKLDYASLEKSMPKDLVEPLSSFMEQELKPEIKSELGLRIEISEKPFGYYDREQKRIFVPLANVYRIYDDLRAKYPEQEEVTDAILHTTLQFYLLSELIRAITEELELTISGWEAEKVDALATVLLLDSLIVDQAYTLDAAEEYLLIDRASGSIQAAQFKTEFEADEYRLTQILCITEAYDSEQAAEPPSSDRVCKGQYEAAMSFWSQTFAENLKPGARLHQWLDQIKRVE